MPTKTNDFFQSSVNIEKKNIFQFLEIAKKFPKDTGFVPCTKNSKLKKIPVKGCDNWETGKYNVEKLSNDVAFERATMLALVLGNEYLAIDCDGISAIEKLQELNFNLPLTLTISSNPGVRCAYIFKINGKVQFLKLDTGVREQLEFRTGNQYQVIAGIHPGTNQPYFTNNAEIAELPESVYNFLKSEEKKEYLHELPYLRYFLTPNDRSSIISGVENNRNDRAISLALNLIGTENRLKELNIEFQETAKDLFNSYCLACNQEDWFESEWQSIWQSAFKKDSQPCYEDQYLKDLNKAWNCDFNLDENIQKSEQNIYLSKFASLFENIQKVKDQNISSEEIALKADEIFRTTFNRHPGYSDKAIIDNIVNELSAFTLSESDKFTVLNALENIKKFENSSLDSAWLFQGISIFKDIKDYSDDNGIPIENLLISFLTVVSSLFSKKTYFNFNTDGITHANIFTIFIGAATSGKSISVDPLKKALSDIAVESNNQYIKDLEIYQKELDAWKELNKAEKDARYLQMAGLYEISDNISSSQKREACINKPVKKHPYIISDASFEAISKLSGEHNRYGLLITPDEITDFIQGIDRINKQKFGALNQFIAVWNGSETLKNRASLDPQLADYYRCSILSTIQTDRFYQNFDVNDSSGIVSRFLFVPISNPVRMPNKIFLEKPVFNLSRNLKDYYHFIQNLINPDIEVVIKQSVKSHQYWATYRGQLEERCDSISDINQGFAQWLNRQPLQCARIAMILHIIRYAENLETDLYTMSENSMLRAIAISRFFVEKASLVFKQTVTKNSENLDQEKVFIFKDFQNVCEKFCKRNNVNIIKVSDMATNSFMRKKLVLKEYSKDYKNARYLKKPEIISLFKEFCNFGIARYEKGNIIF